MVYRETGRAALAESRLRSAVELAVSAGSVLNEAEASREMALLYQAMGRNQEALTRSTPPPPVSAGSTRAWTGVRRRQGVRARNHLLRRGARVGQSIESTDSYTFAIASAWRSTRWPSHGSSRSTRPAKRRSASAPTSTTWEGAGPARDPEQARPAHARRVRRGANAPDLGLELLAAVEFRGT